MPDRMGTIAIPSVRAGTAWPLQSVPALKPQSTANSPPEGRYVRCSDIFATINEREIVPGRREAASWDW